MDHQQKSSTMNANHDEQEETIRTAPSNSLMGLFDPPSPLPSPSTSQGINNRMIDTTNGAPTTTTTTTMTSMDDMQLTLTPAVANLKTTTASPSDSLTGLFAPPPSLPSMSPDGGQAARVSEATALLSNSSVNREVPEEGDDYFVGISIPDDDDDDDGKQYFLHAKDTTPSKKLTSSHRPTLIMSRLNQFCKTHLQPTTFAGAFMFLLYHVVFCLANGSAIIRPQHMDTPILGIMAKLSAVGILFSAPFYIFRLGRNVPALYPSIDLFLAPFLAQAASSIDEGLAEKGEDSDEVFFSTFAVLTAIGMFLSGSFLRLAATFKLANLGTYLPYSVLCGFFSAVGVLLWALAFSVDTSGKTWKQVFFSGNKQLIWDSCLHHIPSLLVGILMNRLGPKNPFFVILLIVATLGIFYMIMWITGTSLEKAQTNQWFWSEEDLVYHKEPNVGFASWTFPPAPFATLWCFFSSYTDWSIVLNKGLGNMFALAFLYLLRSSIHASALKKNVSNLVRRVPKAIQQEEDDEARTSTGAGAAVTLRGKAYRRASEIAQSVRDTAWMVQMSLADVTADDNHNHNSNHNNNHNSAMERQVSSVNNNNNKDTTTAAEYTEIRPRAPTITLEEVFVEYGYALFVVSASGGFGNCPTVATSNTMYAIGADGSAPQYGSVLLLIIFYLTDFKLVKFIPKAAFSSLLVLGAVDTLVVWFWGAFWKTQDIAEWLVVPIIVGFSLWVGFLNAVFLGIAISLFIFVGSFFRVGVVKFNATGCEVRSRIERSLAQSLWLDENGDHIQVLVLQNYLFFGNASSVLNYIATMFEEVDDTQTQRLDFSIPPVPKVLILDMSLISGMDTSTIDIFAEIKEICKRNNCRLFLCGLSNRMRKGLALSGVKPESGVPRLQRIVRFSPDLDTALGSAEEFLLQTERKELFNNSSPRPVPAGSSGFRQALKAIDELHGEEFSRGLFDLEPHVKSLQLEPGRILFECDGGVVQECDRGLFFIEHGEIKIERDPSQSLNSMTRTRSSSALRSSELLTLKHQHARLGSVARKAALAKRVSTNRGIGGGGIQSSGGTLRVARIGPGWVCGTFEIAAGVRPKGVFAAISHCHLHHLPFSKLEELKEENPILILRLYEMLQHLMAHQQESTIEQLSTLHAIMSSPAHSKPISRAALRAMVG